MKGPRQPPRAFETFPFLSGLRLHQPASSKLPMSLNCKAEYPHSFGALHSKNCLLQLLRKFCYSSYCVVLESRERYPDGSIAISNPKNSLFLFFLLAYSNKVWRNGASRQRTPPSTAAISAAFAVLGSRRLSFHECPFSPRFRPRVSDPGACRCPSENRYSRCRPPAQR
jgi:hypothetical protein